MANKKTNYTESNQPSASNYGGLYEVKIRGLLDDHWGQWFEGMTLNRKEDAAAGQGWTLITGPIADQPALHGLLAKIRDLNLTLISVRELDPKEPMPQERSQNGETAESSEAEHP